MSNFLKIFSSCLLVEEVSFFHLLESELLVHKYLQQVSFVFGVPFSFVLMTGCSVNCCETHRYLLHLEFIHCFICAEHSVL